MNSEPTTFQQLALNIEANMTPIVSASKTLALLIGGDIGARPVNGRVAVHEDEARAILWVAGSLCSMIRDADEQLHRDFDEAKGAADDHEN